MQERQLVIGYSAPDGDERLFSISPPVYPKGFAGEADRPATVRHGSAPRRRCGSAIE
jgi:hypothetical protein